MYTFLKHFRPDFYFIFEVNLAYYARTKCTRFNKLLLSSQTGTYNLALLHCKTLIGKRDFNCHVLTCCFSYH